MCGRFTLTVTLDYLKDVFPDVEFGGIAESYIQRYNIAPSQPIAVVPNDGKMTADMFRWGLIPSWAKDRNIGYKLINARGESVAEKPSFRSAYKRRRCLIMADGFYEWLTVEGMKKKLPVHIRMKSNEAFAFAGLWETWKSPEGEMIHSTTIITTDSNELIAKIHPRMPVILPRDAYKEWLDPDPKERDALDHFLRPYPAEMMMQYPVSPEVNSAKNESPTYIVPLTKTELDDPQGSLL